MMFLRINEIMNQIHNVFILLTKENIFRITYKKYHQELEGKTFLFLGKRGIENGIAFAHKCSVLD